MNSSVPISSGGFRFSKLSTGGTWYWSVVADNILGAGQFFYVRDIETPFGKLTDGVDVPIPGDVVQEMAGSMTQLQQQLAPLLALVAGQQTTFNVTVTQGDAASLVGAVNIINAGAFGSFMTAAATPAVPWLSASPVTIPGIGQNQTGRFSVVLDPTLLTAQQAPYTGTVNLQDNRATPTVIPLTVNVTVLPPPVISAQPAAIQLTWTLLTASNSGSQQLTVTNTGPASSILNVTVAKVQNSSPWLAFNPATISGLAGGQSAIVTLSLWSAGIPQVAGTYFEILQISSPNPTVTPVNVQVQLTVS